MEIKKIFFPIGGGDELRERIYGALLVNKWFGSHMSIVACQLDPATIYNVRMTLRGGVLFDEFLRSANEELKEEQENNVRIFKEECAKVGIEVSENQLVPNSAYLRNITGIRSEIVEKHSKYCDLVVAAVPPTGKITGTFEAAVLKSGKSCIVIPREMKKFNPENILVSVTGSAVNSRALTNSIPILKRAKRIHCITARHYLQESVEETIGRVRNYLAIHGITAATYELVETDGKIPGQVLLETAQDGKFDLIVTGMEEDSGFREVFLGGTSTYFLKNTDIPVFM
ncbi:universal stress protein [uncultured Campylobacter sp.]|uniref:universal stress protein n=1 Tax=uncultured Campylobacter sp. TaxID=218934 RepID=UPI00260ACE86|nr:universal stress protein [uncultured Campylobacter sp.]